MSPSLNDSSAGFSASKSNTATADGWLAFVGVEAGEGRGEGTPCACQGDSPKAGLVRWLLPPPLFGWVGVPDGEMAEKIENEPLNANVVEQNTFYLNCHAVCTTASNVLIIGTSRV